MRSPVPMTVARLRPTAKSGVRTPPSWCRRRTRRTSMPGMYKRYTETTRPRKSGICTPIAASPMRAHTRNWRLRTVMRALFRGQSFIRRGLGTTATLQHTFVYAKQLRADGIPRVPRFKQLSRVGTQPCAFAFIFKKARHFINEPFVDPRHDECIFPVACCYSFNTLFSGYDGKPPVHVLKDL